MKKLLFIALLLISCINANSQNFSWAKGFGGLYNDDSKSIAIDAQGNVYTTGSFQDVVDFDPSANTFTLSAIGQYDIFITKYNSSGNFVWVKNIGGSGGESQGNGITTDASGNVYVTGFFSYTADFDPGAGNYTLSAPYITTNSPTNIFVLKLDASGNFVWANNIGTSAFDEGNAITLDANSNVIVTGSFAGITNFNPNGTAVNLGASGAGTDVFVLKLDATGNFIWAKSFGSVANGNSGVDFGKAITTDVSGNIFTTGFCETGADLDPSSATYTFVNRGAFVSKLDASGNFVMAASLGGATSYDNSQGNGIKVDASGNIYTVGFFNNVIDLNPSSASYTFQSTGSTDDMFISKLDVTGNFVWAKHLYSNNSSTSDKATGIDLDASGNLYVTGFTYGDLNMQPNTGLIINGLYNESVILKIDAGGTLQGFTHVGNSAGLISNSIVMDASNNAHITGNFVYTQDFNPDAGINNLTSVAFIDAFILKTGIATFIVNSINELNEIAFNVYPNPSNSVINVACLSFTKNPTTLEITNTLGQVILSKTLTNNNTQINISDFVEGIYYITLKTDNKKTTQKLIIN